MREREDGRLIVRRRFRATPEELFAEWTDAASMGDWMCPGDVVATEVQLDLRVGGALRIVMRDARRSFEHRGVFTLIDRPNKLAFTWIADATDQQRTLVTVEFIPVSSRETELVLTHTDFPRKSSRDQYQSGWSGILDRLEQHRLEKS